MALINDQNYMPWCPKAVEKRISECKVQFPILNNYHDINHLGKNLQVLQMLQFPKLRHQMTR